MRYAYFYPACYSLYAKKRAFHRPALFFYGWGTWIRTKEMPDSESGALPLGYTPISFTHVQLYSLILCLSITKYYFSKIPRLTAINLIIHHTQNNA